MTRSLDDMTEQERAACVGRWAEIRRHLVIIAEIDERHGDATVFRVETQKIEWYFLPDLTPRLDLPRAWTPSGEPVEMEEEFGEVAQGRAWLDGIHNTGRTHLPAGPIRRHVTDWEEA